MRLAEQRADILSALLSISGFDPNGIKQSPLKSAIHYHNDESAMLFAQHPQLKKVNADDGRILLRSIRRGLDKTTIALLERDDIVITHRNQGPLRAAFLTANPLVLQTLLRLPPEKGVNINAISRFTLKKMLSPRSLMAELKNWVSKDVGVGIRILHEMPSEVRRDVQKWFCSPIGLLPNHDVYDAYMSTQAAVRSCFELLLFDPRFDKELHLNQLVLEATRYQHTDLLGVFLGSATAAAPITPDTIKKSILWSIAQKNTASLKLLMPLMKALSGTEYSACIKAALKAEDAPALGSLIKAYSGQLVDS